MGAAAIALVALLAGFLLGRSGNDATVDTATGSDTSLVAATESSNTPESEDPPVALASAPDSERPTTQAVEPEGDRLEAVEDQDAVPEIADAANTQTDLTPAIDTATPTTQAPAVNQVAGPQLFVDPTNSAAQWAANNSTDPRASVIADEIGSQPIARWFGDWNGNVGADVADYVSRATAAGAVPSLVAYNIPDRDCGQHSSGGAANFDQYDAWISSFASGLGNSGAIIVLEPDALALNDCAGSERNDALANAVTTIKNACASCSVYLDAGHSNWVSPGDMASRLVDAGVLQSDGFFTNVSNYNATGLEEAFGNQVLDALGNPSGLAQVIDTSRNGNGANGEWCDAAGRAIGAAPTLQTGATNVDAYLWIKVPGEADGCIAGAGQFVPDRAFELANG